ncbi:NAD(P)H-dependent oxidoreductase [Rhizobium sp. 32-5/1]|uniref:NADPH-dependent FMN reductase n=1 Tax=Rhizobium sp. 32-5/1 TaxID=3019602 RepID=UPI00240D968D|nr:NADPH-dependent FMN reductase [Rhizobium sp. 32-5/1]WEZ82493.1 NAD(P)H-dependent oxidoreductase [Rhizobium sp. 32-5/1]
MAGLFLYALCGSLRKNSSNLALLEAIGAEARNGLGVEICTLIGDLPIFNPDHEGEVTPNAVLELAQKVRSADGLIISAPEYARGIPGGLKNALDWLVSRDELPHKPVMLVHASHRGDYALEALTEVLKTISVTLVDKAFFRINLLGKTPEQRRDILADRETRDMMRTHLETFITTIEFRAKFEV